MNYPEKYDEYGRKLTNARQELEYHLCVNRISYANIKLRKDIKHPFKHIILHSNYKQEDLEIFLAELDTYYYAGYGGQNLEGVVIMDDGAISARDEHDGSEWWEWVCCVDIGYNLKED